MNKIASVFILVLLISCTNKTEPKALKTTESKTDFLQISEKEKAIINFENYLKDGIVLKGFLNLFNEDLNQIGTLEIKEISKIKILEKSTASYNVGETSDTCLKSKFLKITYKNQEYIAFGNNIYEINDNQKFDFINDLKETFSIFPITNFEMGASDDDGLTGCDDFSYLIIESHKENNFLSISNPINQENYSNQRFANLIHDDGSQEKIYAVNVVEDSLFLNIKVSYQEGYGSFTLKSSFKDNFQNSVLSNLKRFDDEKTYNELK